MFTVLHVLCLQSKLEVIIERSDKIINELKILTVAYFFLFYDRINWVTSKLKQDLIRALINLEEKALEIRKGPENDMHFRQNKLGSCSLN